MYDSAAKITNNRVSTSIMFMGITPPFLQEVIYSLNIRLNYDMLVMTN